jgi:hypothetical protein
VWENDDLTHVKGEDVDVDKDEPQHEDGGHDIRQDQEQTNLTEKDVGESAKEGEKK